MANNYTSYAAEFEFPQKAAEDFINILRAFGSVGSENSEEVCKILPEWYAKKYDLLQDGKVSINKFEDFYDREEMYRVSSPEGIEYDKSAGVLYFGSESDDPYAIADILSDVMQEHGCEEAICFEVAFTCSKLRPGEFGGAAIAVGPGIVRSMGTAEMADSLKRGIEAELWRSESKS